MNDGRYGDQRGYTLIELLVVMALSVVVIGGPLVFVVLSLTQQNTASSRAAAVEQEAIGLNRLTRDLRQVVPSTTTTFTWNSTAASVTMTVPQPATGDNSGGPTPESVTWSCAFAILPGSCTRQVTAINGVATSASAYPAIPEVTGVSGVVFAPVDDQGNALSSGSTTQAAYVGVTLKVLGTSQLDSTTTAGGAYAPTHTVAAITQPIVLQDGVALRNNT